MKRPVALPQIDLQKMPLGKLSKRQIQSAYALLSEVHQVSRPTHALWGPLISAVVPSLSPEALGSWSQVETRFGLKPFFSEGVLFAVLG